MMTYWNLLVVVCFGILYLGFLLTHSQIRRTRDDVATLDGKLNKIHALISTLRDEVSINASTDNFPQVDHKADRDAELAAFRSDLAELQNRLIARMSSVETRLHSDIDIIQRQMEAIDSRMDMGASRPAVRSAGGASTSTAAPVNKERDGYREARLLLANGVDEDQVVAETGLSVEEVSLLRRLSEEPNKRR